MGEGLKGGDKIIMKSTSFLFTFPLIPPVKGGELGYWTAAMAISAKRVCLSISFLNLFGFAPRRGKALTTTKDTKIHKKGWLYFHAHLRGLRELRGAITG